MPRPESIPSYRLRKPSGRARVILEGKQIYLGRFGSPESREVYARLIAERFRTGHGGENLDAYRRSARAIDWIQGTLNAIFPRIPPRCARS